MFPRSSRIFSIMVTAALAGCGGSSVASRPSSSKSGDAPVSLQQPVGDSGGTIGSPDSADLTIPPHALSSMVTITLHSTPNVPAPAGVMVIGTPYTFGPEGTTFTTPIDVRLPLDLESLPEHVAPSALTIYSAADGSSQYTAMPTHVANDGIHLVTQTTHFSVYLIGMPSPSQPSEANPPPTSNATGNPAPSESPAPSVSPDPTPSSAPSSTP